MNFYGAFNKRIYGSLFSIDFNAEKDRIGVVSKDGDNRINDINVFLEYTKSQSDKKRAKNSI